MFLIRRQQARTSCSMFLSFLKKWSFNLCLKLLSELDNFSLIGKLFRTIGVRWDKNFWPEQAFFKGYFSFTTEDLIKYLLDFDQIAYIYIMKIQRTSFLKKMKSVRARLLTKSFRNREPVKFFKVFNSHVTSVI